MVRGSALRKSGGGAFDFVSPRFCCYKQMHLICFTKYKCLENALEALFILDFVHNSFRFLYQLVFLHLPPPFFSPFVHTSKSCPRSTRQRREDGRRESPTLFPSSGISRNCIMYKKCVYKVMVTGGKRFGAKLITKHIFRINRGSEGSFPRFYAEKSRHLIAKLF